MKQNHWFLKSAQGETLCTFETISMRYAKLNRKEIALTLKNGEYLSRRFSGPARNH